MPAEKREKPETDGFLAMIDAKIAALKVLADSYRAAVALGALGQPGDIEISVPAGSLSLSGAAPSLSMSGPVELPQGALLGKSIPNAIKLLLSVTRRKLTTREIAAGLKDGGVESTSKFFENTVTTALHRLKASGDVLKFNDGWASADLYSEALRNRLAAQNDPRKSRKAAKTRKRSPKRKTQARLVPLPVADQQVVNG